MTAETMERTWTTVGVEYVEKLGRRAVENEIDALWWQDVPQDGSALTVGFIPGESIKAVIRELRIPKVTRIAISSFERPGFYPGFYGIEGNYTNGRAHVFVLDLGGVVTPLCSDLYPNDQEET